MSKISLVLTDIMMPEMDGFETIKKLRAMNPRVLVIAASGLASNEQRAAAAAFLSKPYTTATLLKTIRICLDSRID